MGVGYFIQAKGEDMSEEKISIEYTRFRDINGQPTCACNFGTGEVCEFFRVQRFGSNETCLFAPDRGGGLGVALFRRTDSKGVVGNGCLIPGAWCPLFREEG
jgi:hypothetical protein